MIISKEWTEEADASSSIIQIYCNPRVVLCTIGDVGPQETFYDPKVGVNVMSKTLADHISSEFNICCCIHAGAWFYFVCLYRSLNSNSFEFK